MCELLGMVSNVPADLAFSFTGLALRGGQTGPHADGWGVSLYDGRFARTFLEPHPAFSSPLARFVRENPMKARLAIAHVRRMTRGRAAIENTHPFLRVYDRRHIVFAHNGTLPNVRDRKLEHESPLGETDSEHAFCVMLESLRRIYGPRYPEDPIELGRHLHELANELGADGVFNFLWADGEHLFARCGDHLSAIVRRAPFGQATLVDADLSVRLEEEVEASPDARMAVVATFPLTRDEAWEEASPGTLWVFRGGDLVTSFK
ncbi:MAG TPA: class II glutamine amidotransferase [Polyangiaceae bacterium]|nr:class II glutamine amidotransferase [Polyangiaceae bacterium]